MPMTVLTALLRPRYLVAALLIVLAGWQWHLLTAQKVTARKMHIDERGWVASAMVYCDLLYKGDFTPSHWEQLNLGPFGNLNPPLGKVMLGMPAYLRTKDTRLKYVPQERLTVRDTMGLCSKAVPNPPFAFLTPSRNTAKFWAGLTAVTLIATVCWLFGSWAGVIFAFTLLWNTTFRNNSAFALTDMPYLFLLNLALIAGITVVKAKSRAAFLAAMALLGLGAGLATSVKVTGIVVITAYAVVLMATLLFTRQARSRRTLLGLATYSTVALLTIFALNPFLWPDIAAFDRDAAAQELVILRDPAKAGISWNEEASLWKSLTEPELGYSVVRYTAPNLRAILRPLEYPLLYPRWSRLFETIAERFPRRATWSIVWESLTGHTSSIFEVGLFLLGFYTAGVAAVAKLRQGIATPALAVMLYVAVQLALLVYAVPVSGFDRYLLPFLVVSKVFVALGVLAALGPPRQLLADLRKSRQSATTSTTAL